MGKPYSNDLRERAVAAVLEGGLSRRRTAAQFGVGVSTVIAWVRRFQDTSSVAPGQMGGHKPKAIRDEHEVFLEAPRQGRRLHAARAGSRARRARPQGRLSVGVELRPRGKAQLQKNLSPAAARLWR